jgi:flavin reductase (NADH)
MKQQAFKEAMARFASGVTVVSAAHRGEERAATVSSFASCSLEPPLVCFALDLRAKLLPLLLAAKAFEVRILGEGDEAIADHFAGRGKADVGLSAIPALAHLRCRLWANYPGGDHQLLVGEVEEVHLGALRDPLVYWHRAYRRLA